jgi:hypothetical protein
MDELMIHSALVDPKHGYQPHNCSTLMTESSKFANTIKEFTLFCNVNTLGSASLDMVATSFWYRNFFTLNSLGFPEVEKPVVENVAVNVFLLLLFSLPVERDNLDLIQAQAKLGEPAWGFYWMDRVQEIVDYYGIYSPARAPDLLRYVFIVMRNLPQVLKGLQNVNVESKVAIGLFQRIHVQCSRHGKMVTIQQKNQFPDFLHFVW